MSASIAIYLINSLFFMGKLPICCLYSAPALRPICIPEKSGRKLKSENPKYIHIRNKG